MTIIMVSTGKKIAMFGKTEEIIRVREEMLEEENELPEVAFPPALEFLQFVCIRFPFQGWWHSPSSLGSSGITRNGDSRP